MVALQMYYTRGDGEGCVFQDNLLKRPCNCTFTLCFSVMGAAQSIPVVGEAVTTIDSGVKLIAAGSCKVVGEVLDKDNAKKAAKSFVKDAGKTWVEYSERNVIAAPIRAAVHGIAGKKDEAKRVIKKMGKSVEEVADSTPVVGHVKGTIHYIAGDIEHGHHCMKGATRSVAVLGAGALTGGVGGGVILGGMAGVSGGLAYDGTVTLIESGVKKKVCPYGVINAIDQIKKSEKENDTHGVISSVIDLGYTVTGDFVSGAGAAKTAKSVKKEIKNKQQRNALKDRIGEDATKDVIDTAKELKNKTRKVKGDKHVCTKTRNLDTGKAEYGFNKKCRRQMRKGKGSGYSSKRNATKGRRGEFSTKNGLLEDAANERNIEINPCENRAPRACAEHHSINKLGTHGGESNVRTCSVKKSDGQYVAVERCGNCKQYGNLMGDVVTDEVAGMPVPTSEVSYGSIAAAGVLLLLCSKCGDEHDEDKKCTCDNKKDK